MGLAAVAHHQGAATRATQLLAASDHLRDDTDGYATSTIKSDSMPSSSRFERSLGDEGFVPAREERMSLGLDEAVAYALEAGNFAALPPME